MARALRRFFVSSSLEEQRLNLRKGLASKIVLSPGETHHLKNVLRIKEGSLCFLFDREGNEFLSRLDHFRKDGIAEATLIELVSTSSNDQDQPGVFLTVAQAIPQDRKMDRIVEKSAELGVFELIPLVTEHTVVRIQPNRFQKVRERWERIARQTLKQSRMKTSPKIHSSISFETLCSDFSQYDRVYLLDPSPDAKPFRDLFVGVVESAPTKGGAVRILLMIGPEGGFTTSEVDQAKRLGAEVISLGKGILKTDTAFVAAVSCVQLIYGSPV